MWRLCSFSLNLKAEPSAIDEEDFELGKIFMELLQRQFAKMALTSQTITVCDILKALPPQEVSSRT